MQKLQREFQLALQAGKLVLKLRFNCAQNTFTRRFFFPFALTLVIVNTEHHITLYKQDNGLLHVTTIRL